MNPFLWVSCKFVIGDTKRNVDLGAGYQPCDFSRFTFRSIDKHRGHPGPLEKVGTNACGILQRWELNDSETAGHLPKSAQDSSRLTGDDGCRWSANLGRSQSGSKWYSRTAAELLCYICFARPCELSLAPSVPTLASQHMLIVVFYCIKYQVSNVNHLDYFDLPLWHFSTCTFQVASPASEHRAPRSLLTSSRYTRTISSLGRQTETHGDPMTQKVLKSEHFKTFWYFLDVARFSWSHASADGYRQVQPVLTHTLYHTLLYQAVSPRWIPS